jgi:drug/metabolite transporter (DMT)-like permease
MNLVLALVCVGLFSLSAPATRLAVLSLPADLVTGARLTGAALVCIVALAYLGRSLPPRRDWPMLVAVALGSAIGFSWFLALAMREVPSTHGAVALGLMPLLTAAYGSLRDREQPGARFWLCCGLGTVLACGFLASRASGQLQAGDAWLGAAAAVSAFGYVEGARLSRRHGGTRVMSWVVLFALPFALALVWRGGRGVALPALAEAPAAWAAVAYLATVSQSLGMFLWFGVLARGPMARIALLQLLQPFLTLIASVTVLGEPSDPGLWASALGVAACVFLGQRARRRASAPAVPVAQGAG